MVPEQGNQQALEASAAAPLHLSLTCAATLTFEVSFFGLICHIEKRERGDKPENVEVWEGSEIAVAVPRCEGSVQLQSVSTAF